MILALSIGEEIEDPSDLQIEDALRRLPEEGTGSAFLARNARSYIEATGNVTEGFSLEYRTHSKQYRSANTALALTDVIEAFQAYGRNDAHRLKQFSWEPERLFLRYGTLLLGGAALLAGSVLHVRLLQASGMMLEAFALALWTWTGLRTGEIHMRGSYCRRARDPGWYWLLTILQISVTVAAVWFSVALLRGSVTFP
jgi:hypothetical protein